MLEFFKAREKEGQRQSFRVSPIELEEEEIHHCCSAVVPIRISEGS